MADGGPLLLGSTQEYCFLLTDDTLVQDGGTGPVVTSLSSGQQKSAFIDQELVTAGTCGQHVLAFAASGQSNSFAFSLSGSPNRLQLVCLRDAPQFTTLEQQRPTTSCAYSNAAISADGRHLLAFCGPAQPYVELWALSPLQLLLTVDVLFQGTGRCLSFYPSNSMVTCCISSRSAEVLCFDKVLGQVIVRKAAVETADWTPKESITCHSWTPSGMLLLGTSAGRILRAEGAIPVTGRPASTWGTEPPICAENLLDWNCTGSILFLHITNQHLLVIHESAGSNAAAAVWLDSHTLKAAASLALPADTCQAWTDCGLQKAVVRTASASVFTLPNHSQEVPASMSLVSKQHVAEVTGIAFLSPETLLSVSQDGVAALWTVSRIAPNSVTVQLCAMESVGCQIACMTAQPDSSTAIIGLSSGHLLKVTVNNDTSGTVLKRGDSDLTVPDTAEGAGGNSPSAEAVTSSPSAEAISSSPCTEPVGISSAALTFEGFPEQHSAAVTALQLSPDRHMLASLSSQDGDVMIWKCNAAPAKGYSVVTTAVVLGATCVVWIPAQAHQLAERLLVGCSNGDLVLMRPAAGSLQGQPWGQQLLWRLQSGPVALAFGSPDTSRPTTGAFYMYAALQDKSVHKYKLIVPASAAKVVPLMSPERGFPMQKVCTALMVKSDGRVLAAGSDGCCYVLDAESLQQDARHILHPSQTGGISAIAVDSSGLLASGSHSGVISLLPTGRAKSCMCLLLPNQHLSTQPPLKQVKTDVTRQEAGSEVNNSEAVRVPGEEQLTLKQQLHSLRTRMEAAIQLNSGLDLQLRLAPDELILNAPLRDKLLAEGRDNISAVRHTLQTEQWTNDIKAAHMKAACWDSMMVPQAELNPVGQACLSTGLGEYEPAAEMVARFTTCGLGPVQNMAIRKWSPEETIRLQQVQFLRQIEMEEWQSSEAINTSSSLGMSSLRSVSTVPSNAGSMTRKQSELDGASDLARSGTSSLPNQAAMHDHVDRGRCGLLYSSMELQTPARQISQAVLLQQEACLIQEAFNRRFQAVQAAKKDLIGGVEERMARSVMIERELGLHGQTAKSCGVLEDPAPDAVLIVQDDEVKADKWVSPEQAQQHEAEQQASNSKSSGSQQGVALRGVRQMLGDQAGVQGGLQGQAQVLPLELARQPWMDLPDSLLMPQQRALLKEHDKKVQDWLQQQQRHKVALETELKTLRNQTGEACFAFDDRLIDLQIERNAAESELNTVELQQVSLAGFYEQQQYLHFELEKVAQQLMRVHEELKAKQALVSDVSQALVKAQGHLEEVRPQGKAVDKAFKRELGPLPYYPDLLLLYQDRTRGYTYQADFRMADIDQMLTAVAPSPQELQMQSPVMGVPFVQRILYERKAVSQPAQSAADSSSRHVSLTHQASTIQSPKSPHSGLQPSRMSLASPSGPRLPSGQMSRSPSMLPSPTSPGPKLSRNTTYASRSSSLKPKSLPPENALLDLKDLGPLGIAPSASSSADSSPFDTELVLKAFTDVPAVPSDSDAAVGPMLSSGDMPPGCKPDHWARLVALRDARLSLEVDAQQLTNTAQLLSAQLDVLQEEESGLVAKLGAAEQAEAEWSNELGHYQSDLQVRLAVQNGQLEAADTQPLTDQSDMLLLDRQEVAGLNSIILGEGQAKLAQQKAVWAAEGQALVAHWEQQHLQLQIQSEQAHVEDMHLLHLSHDSPYRNSGNDKVVVKKETTAALVHKQQARQQAALACVYESELALEAAVAKKGQENTEEAAAMNQLADEVAALTKIYQPIKGHAGDQQKRLDGAMRQSHAVHVLREISHQQRSDIGLLQYEIKRLLERSKASFALQRPVQPDILSSL